MGVNCTDRHGLFKLMGWAWIFVFLSSCAAKIQGWSLVSSSMPGPVLTSLESAPGKPQNSDKHFTGFDLSLVLSASGRFPHSPRADSLAAPGTHPTAPTHNSCPQIHQHQVSKFYSPPSLPRLLHKARKPLWSLLPISLNFGKEHGYIAQDIWKMNFKQHAQVGCSGSCL